MGSFRFLLALLVAYSHLPGHGMPVNLGVSAVVGFYFLSGYLMSWSYSGFREKSADPVRSFYMDRLIRIYPLFLIVFACTGILFVVSDHHSGFFSFRTVLELLIVPHNYTHFFSTTNVIPPGWSLGMEVQFYLLLPFLFLLPKNFKYGLLILLLGLQLFVFQYGGELADLNISFLRKFCEHYQGTCNEAVSDLFGYRWLPVPLLYFLAGGLCFEGKSWRPMAMVSSGGILILLVSMLAGHVNHENVKEVLIGNIIMVPMAYFFVRHIGFFKDNETDKLLGRLAYPLFLVHYLCRWFIEETGMQDYRIIATLLLAFAASYVLSEIQRKIDIFRYNYRGFKRTTEAGS